MKGSDAVGAGGPLCPIIATSGQSRNFPGSCVLPPHQARCARSSHLRCCARKSRFLPGLLQLHVQTARNSNAAAATLFRRTGALYRAIWLGGRRKLRIDACGAIAVQLSLSISARRPPRHSLSRNFFWYQNLLWPEASNLKVLRCGGVEMQWLQNSGAGDAYAGHAVRDGLHCRGQSLRVFVRNTDSRSRPRPELWREVPAHSVARLCAGAGRELQE